MAVVADNDDQFLCDIENIEKPLDLNQSSWFEEELDIVIEKVSFFFGHYSNFTVKLDGALGVAWWVLKTSFIFIFVAHV